jgi:hypothetical protein
VTNWPGGTRFPSGRARRRPEKPLVVVMSAVSAGFASGGPEPAIEYGWLRPPHFYAQCECFGCSFKASPLTELLSYVKLARMRGADLVTESPREDQDHRQGHHVHELCNQTEKER